jgi:mRNA interferase RelE/StbE
MFRIEYSREAIKALMRMPRNTADRIKAKIDGLAVDPYAPNNNVKRLQGSDDYRLRVGDWRVIYSLRDEQLVVEVVKVRPRGGAYE